MRKSRRFILVIAIFLFIFSPGIKSEIVEISSNIYSKDPCVLSFDNKVMVMWAEEVSGNFDLHYRICSEGVWGPKTRFNTGIYNSIYPQLELAPDGKIHAIWMGRLGEARSIYHAHYTDGVWSTPEEVYPSTRRSCWPRLGIMSNGTLCSVWTQAVGNNDQNAIYYTYKTSSWWGPGCLTNTQDTTSIHADMYARDDKVYVCWMDAEGPYVWNLWFSQKQWGGNWTSPAIVASRYAQFPAMAVDSKGDVHSIFFGGGGNTPYYINRVNGTWSSPVQLPYLGKFTKSFVSLDVDKWDYLHAVWRQEHNATDDIGYVIRDEQGNWGTPEYVSNSSAATGYGASKPLVRADNNGYAHIVWLDRRSADIHDEGRIFYNSVQYKVIADPQTLVIQSAPVFGVPITVSPDDINGDGDGNTDFMRIYEKNTIVSLTAPEVYNSRDFIKWVINGTADNYSRTIQINMGESHTVEAVYKTLQTLVIQSAPITGVPITVSPDDINGDGDGNTDFMRIYNEGTMITLTAPDIYNGRDFIKWIIDGTADNYSRTIQINMGESHTVEAVYKTLQTLVIQSAPVFGVPITVNLDDINGDGDGNTDFMRIYNEGIMTTLTAPEVCNDRDFVRWIIDGTNNYSRTIQVNMDNYHMADAIYETDGYEDAGTSVIQTSDGGYIIAGYSNAYTHGGYDFLLYKLDSNGNTQLRKFLGGTTGDEYAYDVKQTSDQGYIVVGSTTSFTHGNFDILVYKMDANGNKQWRKNFGGVQDEEGFSIHQTSDGGYILAGYTYSFTHGEGDSDFIVYKLDGNGNKQWRRNFGGIECDLATYIEQTSDGGYIVSGQTKSFVHGVEDTDLLVYKLSSNGSKQWRRNYGGELDEEGGMIQKTSDGGYILVGGSYSFTHGYRDFIAYKLNANGSKQWRKNFGGTNEDACFSVKQTTDEGYILAGCTYSFTHGDYDFLIYKINSNGNKQWRRNYGGIDEDKAFSIIQTSDGGYMIVGDTRSFVNTPGYKDFLLYKLNANGAKQWRKNLGI